MASFMACARRFNLSPADVSEMQAHITAMGDETLGVQSYLEGLGKETSDLQQDLLDQGVGVDLLDDTPDVNLYQNVAASIRSVRADLRNRPPDIIQALRKLGIRKGADSGEIASIFDDKASTIFRQDGLHPDDARSILAEAGYLPDNGTVNEMWDVLRRANDGEEIFSRQEFAAEIEAYEAAKAFKAEIEASGLNMSDVTADDVLGLTDRLARNEAVTAGKASEAGRSAKKAGEVSGRADDGLLKAYERLEEADARIAELNETVGPKIREEVKAARKELHEVIPKLKKAKDARSKDAIMADMDDLAIDAAAKDAIKNIIGMKPGQHASDVTLSNHLMARTLDFSAKKKLPWLDTNVSNMTTQYHRAIIPKIELARDFPNGLEPALEKITDEAVSLAAKATSEKAKLKLITEGKMRVKEIKAMWGRVEGVYGIPDDPTNVFVRMGRVMRSLSFGGYLGGMTISAMPDLPNIVVRSGIEPVFGAMDALADPKRMGLAVKQSRELGSSAELVNNGRAMAIADVTDEYAPGTGFERGLGGITRGFSHLTGMIAWNATVKTIAGVTISSKMSKAAVAVVEGKASTKQLLTLAENRIDSVMAGRIGKQIIKHGDRDGYTWLPQAGLWDDADAFDAFRNAFTQEIDLAVITPGQDKPLSFSTEAGKFVFQFKSFPVSAHHRMLLAGLQRHEMETLFGFALAIGIGAFVSNIKADIGGYDRKEGAALWEDAFDRSGWAAAALEVHGVANAVAGGALSVSGETTSRFASRSAVQGVAGPSFDMGVSFLGEALPAAANGKLSNRDARKLLRPVPGNNLPYVMWLTNRVSEAMGGPRP